MSMHPATPFEYQMLAGDFHRSTVKNDSGSEVIGMNWKELGETV